MRHVLKIGGSLLELPNLLQRIDRILAGRDHHWLLLVGGGAAADAVRRWDKEHRLGDQQSHWLAVRAMQFNTHLLLALWPDLQLVGDEQGCVAAWRRCKPAIVDPLAWLTHDQRQGIDVPHRWSFTSDSIAAHLARRVGAGGLTMLKSTLPKGPCTLQQAGILGIVDADFALTARELPLVELVNPRQDPPARCVLQEIA
jgi:5-(aminomethyl)-3-furanmethanol phosphate kinase